MKDFLSYSELPVLGDLGVRHAWSVLDSEIGTLSFIDSDKTAEGARLVREGRAFSLNLAIDAFDPPLFGRSPVRHVVEVQGNEAQDVLDAFNPQASSQLDGLAHVRAREHGFFGGRTDLEAAREQIGIHHVAARGIATRGVLLDLAGHDEIDKVTPFDGRMYDAGLLAEIAREQGVDVRAGDVVLIHTGWTAHFLRMDAEERAAKRAWNGLRADEAMAQWLWDRRVAAVGADNPAVEAAPGSRDIGSLHRRLIPALGMSMFELLDLEALAAACRVSGRWEFFFVSVPLRIAGGVSSPANAMAIL